MRRGLVSTVLLAVAGLALIGLQLFVDGRVARYLRPLGGALESSLGRVVVRDVALGAAGATSAHLGEVVLSTGLIRKDCRKEWTFGWGARVVVRDVGFELNSSAERHIGLEAKEGCFDVRWEEPWGNPTLRLRQVGTVSFSGLCGPDVSSLELSWTAPHSLHLRAEVSDRSRCLKKLAFLAPQYPDELIPESVRISFDSDAIHFNKPELPGSTAVALVAELSRRLEDSELSFGLSFTTTSGEKVAACIRRKLLETYSEFEIELGASEQALRLLSEPFLSEDNRRTLADLRTDEARCDGSGQGLFFASDLHEVRLDGASLPRRTDARLAAPGFRHSNCPEEEDPGCQYRIGMIQMGENGRLLRPPQLEAILRSKTWERNEPSLLLVFVHGWRHDAASTDQNLLAFEGLLRELAKGALSLPEEERPSVSGVFLSWPGRMFDSYSANKLATFWNRLEVARGLGERDGDLELVLRQLADAARARGESGRVIALSHSMGADPLLQVLSRRADKTPLVDAALLVNPAVSVARLRALRPEGSLWSVPTIAYGAESDHVNQQLFPLGEAVQFRGDSRQELFEFTTPFVSDPGRPSFRLAPRQPEGGEQTCVSALDESSATAACLDFMLSDPAFRVVTVDERVIAGHADFLTPPFVDHLVRLLLPSFAERAPSPSAAPISSDSHN